MDYGLLSPNRAVREMQCLLNHFIKNKFLSGIENDNQAPVVQTMDSAIHRINHYPVDKY